jgi:hypothetical protein
MNAKFTFLKFLLACSLLLWGLQLQAQKQNCFQLYLEQNQEVNNDTLVLELKARNWNDAIALQFSLKWDRQVMRLVGANDFGLPNVMPNNFGLPDSVRLGQLRFSWFNATLKPVPPTKGRIARLRFLITDRQRAKVMLTFGQAFSEFVTERDSASTAAHIGLMATLKGNLPTNPINITSICAFNDDCRDLTKVGIDLAVSGGSAPYRYFWNGPKGYTNIQSTLRGILPGEYEVMVISADGRDSIPASVTVPRSKSIFIESNLSCEPDGSAKVQFKPLSGLAPFTYQISNGTTQTQNGEWTLNVPFGQNLSVVASDSKGCVTEFQGLSSFLCTQASTSAFVAVGSVLAERGDEVCLPVNGLGLDSVRSMSFDLVWKNDELEFLSWNTSLSNFGVQAENFDLSEVKRGRLRFTWENTFTGIREDSLPLFRLCFRVLQGGSPHNVSSSSAEATGIGNRRLRFAVLPGAVIPRILYPELEIGSGRVAPGATFCTKVSVRNYSLLSSVQFGLRWDPRVVQFQSARSLNPLVDPRSININNVNNGALVFDNRFPSIPIGKQLDLIELCFKIANTRDSVAIIRFDDQVQRAQFIDTKQELTFPRTFSSFILIQPSLWPGDADLSGTVDNFDLLPIGLAFGKQGPQRQRANLSWDAQATNYWNQNLPNGEIDLAFIDADGNGLINEFDTAAILKNWRESHDKGRPLPLSPQLRAGGVPFFINVDTVYSEGPQWLPVVLGTPDKPVETAYGLGFTIFYNPVEVKGQEIDFRFEDSWLGKEKSDLLHIQYNNSKLGRIDLAVTRKDGRNMRGQGPIGKVKITIEDVILGLRQDGTPRIRLEVGAVRLINSQEELIAVSSQTSNPIAKKGKVTRSIDRSLENQVRIYPQPAQNQLFIDLGQAKVKSMQLIQADGRPVSSILPASQELDLQNLPNGLYYLRLIGEKGIAMKKILIAR